MSCVKGGSWGTFELNFEVEMEKVKLADEIWVQRSIDICVKIFLNISLGISWNGDWTGVS